MPRTSTSTNSPDYQGSTSGSTLVKGCLIGTAIVVISGITLVVVGYFAFQHYVTDDQPMPLSVVEMDLKTYDALAERAKAFAEAIDSGESTHPIQLDEAEINALIQNHSNWGDITETQLNDSKNIYVTIEGDTIGGQISMPLGNRYVNATATFDFRFVRDRLYLYIEEGTVKGEPLPEVFLSQLRGENLAAEMMNDPDTQAFFENIETVEVADSTIIITPKTLRSID